MRSQPLDSLPGIQRASLQFEQDWSEGEEGQVKGRRVGEVIFQMSTAAPGASSPLMCLLAPRALLRQRGWDSPWGGP